MSWQDLDPHIYPVAENAYTAMVRDLGKVNQSIIISGESGAGKVGYARVCMLYVVAINIIGI